MQEIVMISATSAAVIWAMEDVVRCPDGSGLRGYGYYHDSNFRLDGIWHIHSSRLARLFVLPFGC